jgi:hypothetical protein
VRLRFQLAASDPMTAIIGAFGRLTDAGMDEDGATETVLRILRELETGRAPIGTPPESTRTEGPVTPCGLPAPPAPARPSGASYTRGKAPVPPHGAC